MGVVTSDIGFRLSVTVEASEAGFDIKQGAGNIHQGAVIHGVGLAGELFHQFDLFGNDFAGYPKAQYGQSISDLAQARKQFFQFIVLA